MDGILFLPALLQALAMFVDEGWFHRRRSLPRWERLGHPLDTLTTACCYAWLSVRRPEDPRALPIYIALAAFSCLFITKDEIIHARRCSPGEIWLHALLFVLHPIVFIASAVLWSSYTAPWFIELQLTMALSFGCYQVFYWIILHGAAECRGEQP